MPILDPLSFECVSHSEEQTKRNMDKMYRWTRHIYDASRKYYLLGRDVLIDRLSPAAGESV